MGIARCEAFDDVVLQGQVVSEVPTRGDDASRITACVDSRGCCACAYQSAVLDLSLLRLSSTGERAAVDDLVARGRPVQSRTLTVQRVPERNCDGGGLVAVGLVGSTVTVPFCPAFKSWVNSVLARAPMSEPATVEDDALRTG